MGIESFTCEGTEAKSRSSYDATDSNRTGGGLFRHRGLAIDPLSFADRFEVIGALLSQCLSALYKDSLRDVVVSSVVLQVSEAVVRKDLRLFEEMKMWVDDRALGIDRFFLCEGKPVRPEGHGACRLLFSVFPHVRFGHWCSHRYSSCKPLALQ